MTDMPDPVPAPDPPGKIIPTSTDPSDVIADYQAQGSELAVFIARLQAQGEHDLRSAAQWLDYLNQKGAPDWVVTEAQLEHEFEAGFMVATKWIAAALEEGIRAHQLVVMVHIAPSDEG